MATPPNQPPQPPYPPQQYPPQQYPPQQYPPQQQVPPPKKTSPFVWILGGCALILVLGVVVTAISLYMIGRKVKEVAGGNPAAVVKMIASMNPDVEVLSTDDAARTVTIRNKRDGKVVTMNFDDIKNGKFTIKEDGKEEVTFQGGQGGVVVKTGEGTAQFGAGGKIPAWVPAYPGSSVQPGMVADTNKELSVTYTFTTKDSVDKVSSYYQTELKSAGYKVENAIVGGLGGSVVGTNDKRTINLALASSDGQTSVTVVAVEKK